MEKSKAETLTSILHEDSTPSNVRMPSGKYGNLECVAVRNSKANPKGLNFCTLRLHYNSPSPSSSLHTPHIPKFTPHLLISFAPSLPAHNFPPLLTASGITNNNGSSRLHCRSSQQRAGILYSIFFQSQK